MRFHQVELSDRILLSPAHPIFLPNFPLVLLKCRHCHFIQ